MNSDLTINKFIYVPLFIAVFFVFILVLASSANAQATCSGNGTVGIGGPRIPDLNSDGCVDETDVSILLGCFGVDSVSAPAVCIFTPTPTLYVILSPSSAAIRQGQTVSFNVTATGAFGVAAGNVDFGVIQCADGSVTCTLSATSCSLPADGSCFVTLDVTNTNTSTVGSHQLTVGGDYMATLTDDGSATLSVTAPPSVFVSSDAGTGNIEGWARFGYNSPANGVPSCDVGGQTADVYANCICTHLANASSNMRTGEYHAWLSANSGGTGACVFTANNNFAGAELVPLVKVNNQQIAYDWMGLRTSTLQSLFNLNEFGNGVSGNTWTNTNTSGNCYACPVGSGCGTYSCMAWTDENSFTSPGLGQPSANNSNWVQYRPLVGNDCNDNNRLYCVYYDSTIPISWGLPVP